MAQTFIQGKEYILSGSGITSTATSITLTSFKFPNSGDTILTADLGSIQYATLEPGTDREEIISFTAVTQNAGGTATISGVTRGLDFASPYTAVAALKKAHAGGTKFVISNNPQMYDDMTGNKNDETITGTWTFTDPALPRVDTYSAPTDAVQFATKGYVDATATGTTNVNRIVVSGTSGDNITAGSLVYRNDSYFGRWVKFSATSENETEFVGIAQGTATDGNSIPGGVLLKGRDSNQTGLTANTIAYLTDTSGVIGSVAGTIEMAVGMSISTTAIDFDWLFDRKLTFDEIRAISGNNGTPASGNKFVTQKGFQRATETYAASSAGSDTYAVTLDPVPAAYVAGMTVKVKVDVANTGAATLNVNSLGAKSITKNGTKALVTGDIVANQVLELIYDGTQFQLINETPLAVVFGGDGSDGALNVTSGTTNIDASSANLVVKNYTTANISVGATLGLTNPASTGTVLYIKVQGDVTIAGTIDLEGDGAVGGAAETAGTTGFTALGTGSYNGKTGGGIGGAGGAGGAIFSKGFTTGSSLLHRRTIIVTTGAGGAGGHKGNATSVGGAGGNGGGAIIIEVGGALNFTGSIKVDGVDGSAGTTGSGGGGGGGGGSAGMAIVLYKTLTANSGTVTATGGAGGGGGDASGTNNGGNGGGGGGSLSGAGGAGGAGGTSGSPVNAGNAGAAGAGGGGGGGQYNSGSGAVSAGAGGADDTTAYFEAQNIWFN